MTAVLTGSYNTNTNFGLDAMVSVLERGIRIRRCSRSGRVGDGRPYSRVCVCEVHYGLTTGVQDFSRMIEDIWLVYVGDTLFLELGVSYTKIVCLDTLLYLGTCTTQSVLGSRGGASMWSAMAWANSVAPICVFFFM